ncbi:NAD(P)/FAD-dependent oxidoreductase [Thermodesulfobacteriota bacterium]
MSEIAIAIIGGGVIGCAVAQELSKRYQGIYLFEKNPGITRGENQSSRNSGVIHSGIYYDRETRPFKATFCVEGNSLLYEFCEDHRVPALKTGKLIVATTENEDQVLDIYLQRAKENGVPDVDKLSNREIRAMEANVKGRSALHIPSAGIVDPAALVYRLHTLAQRNGVQTLTGTEVVEIQGQGDSMELTLCYPDGTVDQTRSRIVVNASGVNADRVARQIDPTSPYELDPIRGESYKYYSHKRPELALAGRNIYPTPQSVMTAHGRHFTVGVHLTPTFEDLSVPPRLGSTVTVGPILVPAKNRSDVVEVPVPAEDFVSKVHPFFPGLKRDDLIWHQAGLQARLKNHPDFIIQPDNQYSHVFNLLGVDSPGLTSCLAIARRVARYLETLGLTS